MKILEMAINGSGIRDTARVLKISTDTVIDVLKKETLLNQVNIDYINSHKNASKIKIELVLVDEVEMDEMWSFVQKKKEQYLLWHAIDHKTGVILAYVFSRRKDVVLKKLLKLLRPYKICKVYADGNYVYGKYIGHNKVNVGKRNTQKIERIHLSLRTWVKRLARKNICFSKTYKMHEIVVGLCINIRFFWRNLF